MDIAMSVFNMVVLTPERDKAAFGYCFLGHYLRGYRRERPLEECWLAQLSHFLKQLELDVYTQVYRYHDPADVTSWVGRFYAKPQGSWTDCASHNGER